MRKFPMIVLALTLLMGFALPVTAQRAMIPEPGPEPNYDLEVYTFDQDLEGWQFRSAYQAATGTPAIEHSTALGNGALKINAEITALSNWQEFKLSRNIASIGQATTVSFDVYMDMSLIDIGLYGASKIKPYIAIDPGWIKFGQNESVSTVNALERVIVDGKEYGKMSVLSRLIGGHEAGAQLNINILSDGLIYTGPIYIDNVKVRNAPFGGGTGGEPDVLPDNDQTPISTSGFDISPVKLVDEHATAETRSLFAYLKNISGDHLLFGHQNSTTRGATITQNNGTQSDVFNSVGAFPAVYGWDTNSIEGIEPPYSVPALQAAMRLAYERDGIIALSAHMPNFVSGGNFYDTTRAVEHILPGGSAHQQFLNYLDMIANFANTLVDSEGTPIPVIFRPFHEHNGSWFWWGASHVKNDEYITIYRFTVEYLRDVKGVGNFLYAFSPNGFFNGDPEQYLYRYPGDEYVDVLGFDIYDGSYNQIFRDELVQDAAMLTQLAASKGKIAALTEAGVRNGHTVSGNPNLNWWSEWLEDVKADPNARKLAYILTWTNSSGNAFWVPYRNHPVFGNNEMLDDFINFYNDDYTAFGDQLTGVYDLNVQASTAASPHMHIVSPVNNRIVSGPITIRAGAYNEVVTSVSYSINGGLEIAMPFNPVSGYYEAEWTPLAEQNQETLLIAVKVNFSNNTQLEQQSQVIVLMDTVKKEFLFSDASEVGTFSNGGVYKAAFGTPAIQHNEVLGALQVNADISGVNVTEAWQELKLKIGQIQNVVALSDVDKVTFDMLIPEAALPTSLNQDEAKLLPNIYLFPNIAVKYGRSNPQVKLSDLPRVTVNGAVYAKHSVSIDLTGDDKKTATDLVISLVSNKLAYTGPIYLDNLQFIDVAEGIVTDPSMIDNFESYDGDAIALREAFPSTGDFNVLSLAESPKHNGLYAMRYNYHLGSNGYTGILKPLSGADWSVYDKLQLWYKPDGSGQKLVIQIKALGMSFEYYPSLTGTEAQLLEIPFSAFHPAAYEANQSATLDAIALRSIERFGIYVNASSPGYTGSGTLYFDDIQLLDGGSEPEEPVEPVGNWVAARSYDFEEDSTGWSGYGNSGQSYYAGALHSTDLSRAGNNGAFRVNVNYTGNSTEQVFAKVKFDAATAMNQYQKIEYELYLPVAMMASGTFKVRTVFDTPWNSSLEPYYTANAEEIVTINGVNYCRIFRSVAVPNTAGSHQAITIVLEAGSKTYTGPIYLDNVKFLTLEE